MSQSTVKEIMIPCSELSSISADASLGEAILALGEVVDAFRHGGRSSRVLLVTDSTGHMVGKLTPVDILRGMEAPDNRMAHGADDARLGRVHCVIDSCLAQERRDSLPWDTAGSLSRTVKVRDIMQKIGKDQLVNENDNLNEVVHHFAKSRHNNLFVAGARGNLVGVLDVSAFYGVLTDNVKRLCPAA